MLDARFKSVGYFIVANSLRSNKIISFVEEQIQVESNTTISITSYQRNAEEAFQRLVADMDTDKTELEKNVNEEEVADKVFTYSYRLGEPTYIAVRSTPNF